MKRREFLKLSAACSAVSLFPANGFAAPYRTATVLVEKGQPESAAFAAALSARDVIEVDGLSDIVSYLSSETPALLIGLTTDPAAMIVEQLMREQRAKRIYQGQHRYQRRAVSHEMTASTAALLRTLPALQAGGGMWAAELGQRLSAIPLSGEVCHRRCVTTRAALPRKGLGYFVSWAWRA